MLPSRCARLDEVVARVEVAVVLERHALAAGGLEDAEAGDAAHVGREHAVEELHEHLADVAAHPLVEDRRSGSGRSPSGCTLRVVTVPGRPPAAGVSTSTMGMSWT